MHALSTFQLSCKCRYICIVTRQLFAYVYISSFELSIILQNVDFRFLAYHTDDDRWIIRCIFRFQYLIVTSALDMKINIDLYPAVLCTVRVPPTIGYHVNSCLTLINFLSLATNNLLFVPTPHLA